MERTILHKLEYYDIYLSYNKSAQEFIDRLCYTLRANNLRVYYSTPFNTSSGQYDESMQALQKSLLFVSIQGQDYLSSLKCRVDFSLAIDQKLSILNLRNTDKVSRDASLLKDRIDNETRVDFEFSELDFVTYSRSLLEKKTNSTVAMEAIVATINRMIDHVLNTNQSYKLLISSYKDFQL